MGRVVGASALFLLAATLFGQGESPAGLEIQIIYDDTSAQPDLVDDWGFSALVTFGDRRVLFDSGADAGLFLENLSKLDIDPGSITDAVISHQHSDHIGGIYRLALKNHSMKVYFLDCFPAKVFEIAMAVGLNPYRVKGPGEIAPGIYTTGPVEGKPPEQALVVETDQGLVVLVGGSHAGVARLVETAEKQRGTDSVRLLLGGFHMMRQSEDEIRAQIQRLEELHVEQVAPAHSTGERAKHLFRQAYGARFLPAGAGRRLVVK